VKNHEADVRSGQDLTFENKTFQADTPLFAITISEQSEKQVENLREIPTSMYQATENTVDYFLY
jgi:hypothetical protein